MYDWHVRMEANAPFPISKTKIMVPRRRPEIVTRPRLIDELHDLLNKKLTLISAPAGYGKTSLLIDLVEQSEIPVCWLALDALDQEPQRFLSYFTACIAERFPAFGKEALALVNSISSMEKDNERVVVTLTNEIYQTIHEHFAILLDDYHFVDSVSEISLFLNRFINLVGENCHVILISRTLPSLPDLHLLAARDQVGGISFEDLAFLPEEIQAFFRQNAGQVISEGDAAKLAKETEGWITSLTLTSLSLSSGKSKRGVVPAKSGAEAFDFFDREILEKQPADLREFLLLTSLFDEVELDLTRQVLDPFFHNNTRDWRSFFNKVQRGNLFVIPLGNDGKSFRYHHLFQDFLRGKAQEENPELVHDVIDRLANVYKERQEWERAHSIYENIGDQEALITLIEEAGTHFIRNGRVATLGNWLERLPVSVLQQNPALLSLQGTVTHTQGETLLGISLLSQAEAAFRENHDINNLCVTLVRRAGAYRQSGNYALAMADADEVIRLTERARQDNLQDSFAAAQRVKGLTLYFIGKVTEAIPWLENALHLFSFLRENSLIPTLEMELGLAYSVLGDNDTALKFYHRALKTWEEAGNVGWQATLLNNMGVVYHARGEYEQAFVMLEKALEYARRSGYVRVPALALCSLGDLLADLDDLDHSDECYEKALALPSQMIDGYLICYVLLAKARIARLRNNLENAQTLLADVFPQIESSGSKDEEARYHLEKGRLLLFSKQTHESIAEFSSAVKLYESSGRLLDLCISRLWLACALTAHKKQEDAIVQFRILFSDSRNLKEPGQLYVNARQLRQWLEKIKLPEEDLQNSLEQLNSKAESFRKNIPSLRRKLRRISQVVSISPPHLVIRAFGPAQVFCNGKKITLSDWQTRETRDLFFFFLSSKPVTKEEIASVFWPDISPSHLKMRFKTSIYRLRRAVGQETILFEDERYSFNHGMDYEYDIEKFHAFLRQADETKNIVEAIKFLNAAIGLVDGPYLADVDGEWAVQERMRVNELYQTAILRLAELYLKTGQTEEVLRVCRVALLADPLLEEAYRLNMRAYAILGDRAAIARQFQICRDIFEDELGVKPSKETELLYRQLV